MQEEPPVGHVGMRIPHTEMQVIERTEKGARHQQYSQQLQQQRCEQDNNKQVDKHQTENKNQKQRKEATMYFIGGGFEVLPA